MLVTWYRIGHLRDAETFIKGNYWLAIKIDEVSGMSLLLKQFFEAGHIVKTSYIVSDTLLRRILPFYKNRSHQGLIADTYVHRQSTANNLLKKIHLPSSIAADKRTRLLEGLQNFVLANSLPQSAGFRLPLDRPRPFVVPDDLSVKFKNNFGQHRVLRDFEYRIFCR
ncbi:hypothetical protein D3C73_1034390 [compost metagenome]